MTVEQYLDMTDEDIEFMVAYNLGNHATTPFYNSVIKSPRLKPDKETSTVDKSIDFTPEYDEVESRYIETIFLEDINPDDVPDLEDFEND